MRSKRVGHDHEILLELLCRHIARSRATQSTARQSTMMVKDQKSDCSCALAQPPSRRNLLLKVGAGLNGIAAALIGVPLLGYVLSSFTRNSPKSWISLGPLDRFPQGETRLAVYRNPDSKPWDGDTAEAPCWVRRIDSETFQVFAINCTHLGCPVR